MSKYLDKSIDDIHKLIVDKKVKPSELVEEAFERIEKDKDLNAFITLNEKALDEAKELDSMEPDNLFFGIPIAVKDNIITKDLRTTCASKILENFVPIYDATVVEKLKEHHMIIIGKTNMDEFAMGSTSKTSYFGAPHNPWNVDKISGGSSGGSAVSVASRMVPLALGSDTGGSVRQPASYNGLVGMKPTYGRVSRYGLVAFASSLDQIGVFSRNVKENAEFLSVICGKDDKDLTSSNEEVPDFTSLIGKSVKGMKIAIPNYFVTDIVEKEVLDKFNELVKLLKDAGCSVDYIDINYLDNAVTLYQIIAMGEASSNLARFDGIRYGYRTAESKNLDELYTKTRGEAFGEEVKRRIMVGSYILSGENAKIYYNKALQVRDDIRKSFREAFKKYDLIIGPTTTTTAYNISEEFTDPSKSFLDDVLVIPVNMAGLPGLNIPIGFSKDHMPIGAHIIGNDFDEVTIYKLASYIEKKLDLELDPRKVK